MKKLHWSKNYADFINIEVVYEDGSIQGWGYDCPQYDSLAALKTNMAGDFDDRLATWVSLTVFILINEDNITANLDLTDAVGEGFVNYVFESIEELN